MTFFVHNLIYLPGKTRENPQKATVALGDPKDPGMDGFLIVPFPQDRVDARMEK